MNPCSSALLTDLYQLTMLQGYYHHQMEGMAAFEFYVRRLPSQRHFLVAAGLEQVLSFLEEFRFTPEEIEWLGTTGHFDAAFLEWLAALRFSGDVDAVPEGTLCFGNEPLLRVTAPLPQAQVVETRLINLLHFQTLIASKAVRVKLAAGNKLVVDFGLRRAHGAEAGLLAARAGFLAGLDATSNVLAGQGFQIPISGTMAHSFIQAHDQEAAAFENFARANPGNVTLLVDTYDTEAGAQKVAALAPRLKAAGISIRGVRLDSGNLAIHAAKVRRILDDGGLTDVHIFASGNLDEFSVQAMIDREVPVDGFGVGTHLDTSDDCPHLDCVYKLQAYEGKPRYKRSEEKTTLPGTKQVFRVLDAAGKMDHDILATATETHDGVPLLQPVVRNGKRLAPPPALSAIRSHLQSELARLPVPLKRLSPAAAYSVRLSNRLAELAKHPKKIG